MFGDALEDCYAAAGVDEVEARWGDGVDGLGVGVVGAGEDFGCCWYGCVVGVTAKTADGEAGGVGHEVLNGDSVP